MKFASGVKALLAVSIAFAALATPAQAATVSATIGPDPLEDRAFNITVTSDDPSRGVYGRIRAAPGPACGASWKADQGDFPFYGSPTGTTKSYVSKDPGSYKLCLWLQNDPFADASAAVGEVPFAVRANMATIVVQAPVTAPERTPVTVLVAGTTEVPRQVFVESKPAGAGPCAASAFVENASSVIANALPANGIFALPVTSGPSTFSDPGRYVICAWVQEDLLDDVAETVGSTLITIGPPLPVISNLRLARAALGRSGTRVSFRLNTAATVRFRVQERRLGRRVGASCLRPTRALRRNARCTRYVSVAGGFSRKGKTGTNSFRYTARTSGRRLLSGRYRLLATPRNATGRGNTLRRSFRVLRVR